MKIGIVIIAFLFTGYVAKAQEIKPEIKKVERTNVDKSDKRNDGATPVSVMQISSSTPKKSSPYYLNNQVILEKLNVKTIPSDYPKYNSKISKSSNLDLIEKWMRKNRHLIKDKYKAQYK